MTGTVDSVPVYARDRIANLTLVAAAVGAWAAVAWLFTTRSPIGDSGVQMSGAILLGAAVGVSMWPLFWLVAFAARHRIAHRGDWIRAGRRALLVALVVTLFVVLQELKALDLPIAAFVVAIAVLVELSLTLRR
jgi:hypothetical protein